MPQPERKKEEDISSPPRGWAGKNPQTYHSLTAATSYLTTLVGCVFAGHFLAQWLEEPWILLAAVAWGMFGGLFFLLKRLNELEKRYGKKEEE